jgi:hypothetical protein
MRSLLLVESSDLRPSNQYILMRMVPSCLRFAKMCLCQVSLLSRYTPRCLTASSWGSCTLFIWSEGHVSLHVVNVMWIDLDLLAFILHFFNQFWVASRSVCSFCETMDGPLSMVTTAVSWAKVAVVDYSEAGRYAVYSRSLGDCLGLHLHWLMTVLCTRFQPLRGSVCYVNRILG